MPKIVGGSLEAHRAATRDRVFDALVRLLQDRPFAQITMAQLAAEAGVGRSALYNHFKDKDAVVLAFATDETERYLEHLTEQLAQAGTPTERLRAYVLHHVAAESTFHLGLAPELGAMLSVESRLAMREHVVAVERVLREILTDGAAAGEFDVPDLGSAVPLIHATLQARHATAEATVAFVLNAVRCR